MYKSYTINFGSWYKGQRPRYPLTEGKVKARVWGGLEPFMYVKLTWDATLGGLEKILKDFRHVSVDEAKIRS